MQEGDAELLWPATADPMVSRFMAWEPHVSRLQTEALVKHEVERRDAMRGVTWVIEHRGKFCGIISLIGLIRTHRALRYDKAELAYWLVPDARQQGYMTEAAEIALKFAFDELGLHKLCVSHFGANDDSRRLIIRLGFRQIGEQIAEFQKAGVWHNHILYEMLIDEFRQRHQRAHPS